MFSTVNISRKKGPLYLQIRDTMRDRILHGVYPKEMNIPSETELENEFAVSKITIRKAIEELVQEGYLEKKSGKGTKVIRNRLASKLSTGKRFTEFLVEEGYKIHKKVLKTEVHHNLQDQEIAKQLGDLCLYIERLYQLDGVPYIHFSHYLSNQLKKLELSDVYDQSLYQLITEQGMYLNKFQDQFAVAPAPEHVEKHLGVEKGTSLLKRMRYSFDDQGNLIEYSVGYYNTGEHHYIVNYDG